MHNQGHFSLVRYFLLTSLLGLAAIVGVLFFSLRVQQEETLIEHEGKGNANVAQLFANSSWVNHREFIASPQLIDRAGVLADPALPALTRDIAALVRGMKVLKVKIYNRRGLTIYSTDPTQIGESKAGNQGFLSALGGNSVSQITHRDHFDSFEGVISDRDLLSSYVPILPPDEKGAVAVMEIYSDVTAMMKEDQHEANQLALLLVAAMGGLYLFLGLIVLRAVRIMRALEAVQREQDAQIRHMAFHDALTDLPNRAAFEKELDSQVTTVRAGITGLMALDLDRFKSVNDTLGHPAGDRLLKLVAERLRNCMRELDVVFRVGGDEFIAVLHNADRQIAEQVAARMVEALQQPFTLGDRVVNISVSIGIALSDQAGDRNTLLRSADRAMYRAKQAGRGRYAFADSTLGTA
jgi:diguanylate cyclase (GGDEF)-like protein